MIGVDHFGKLAPPWVLLSVCSPESLRAEVRRRFPRFRFAIVRGSACRTATALFDEFARALKFPDYFGRNWDAFDECINDLGWLRGAGYVIAVGNAEQLLVDDPAQYDTLIEILSETGKEWAAPLDRRPKRPFHTVLAVSSSEGLRQRDWRLTQASFDPAGR